MMEWLLIKIILLTVLATLGAIILIETFRLMNKCKWNLKPDQKKYGINRLRDAWKFMVLIYIGLFCNRLFYSMIDMQVIASMIIMILLVVFSSKLFRTFSGQMFSLYFIVLSWVGSYDGLVVMEVIGIVILIKWIFTFCSGIDLTIKFRKTTWVNKKTWRGIKDEDKE